jgi:hypothetical protein
LLKIAWIGFVWGSVVCLRSAALRADQPEPLRLVGEWEARDGSDKGLRFAENGEFQETIKGNLYRSGLYVADENHIRVVGVRGPDGEPIMSRFDEWMRMDEINLKVVQKKRDRLEVIHREDVAHFVNSGRPYVLPAYPSRVVYGRQQ